jgi:hypothetical protein
LAAFHVGGRDVMRGDRVVVVALADHAAFGQRLQAIEQPPGIRQLGLHRGLVGLGARQCRLERYRVEREQRLAGPHCRAFGVVALEDDAGHAGPHLDFTRALGLAGVLEAHRAASAAAP